jgi:hypothetical protein
MQGQSEERRQDRINRGVNKVFNMPGDPVEALRMRDMRDPFLRGLHKRLDQDQTFLSDEMFQFQVNKSEDKHAENAESPTAFLRELTALQLRGGILEHVRARK